MSKPPAKHGAAARLAKLGFPPRPEHEAQALRAQFASFVDNPQTREQVSDTDDDSIPSDPEVLPTLKTEPSSSNVQPHRSASESTVKDSMSKPVLFYGKPSQLDPCLTFCTVKFLSDAVTGDTAKSGFLASLFRGTALTWLTQELARDPQLLTDYDAFVDHVRADFDLDPAAKNGQAARQLSSLRQRGSVHDYAQKYKFLSNQLQIPEAVAIANFTKGLKRHIRSALIINDERSTLDTAITEATRIDSQLFYAQPRTQGHGKPKGSARDRAGRFKKSGTVKTEDYEY